MGYSEMVFWILAGLGVYLIGLYLATVLYIPQLGVENALSKHDESEPRSALAARANQASRNLAENLPFFLTLGLLSLVVPEADAGQAVLGASIFVLARIAYIPAYLSAIPWLRTGCYGVSMLGLIIMLVAIL